MHSLEVLKHACESALDLDDETPGDLVEFRSVVDPGSILELISMVEAGWADDERQALADLLRDLTDYVRRTPDSTERDDLILRSRQLRGLMGI